MKAILTWLFTTKAGKVGTGTVGTGALIAMLVQANAAVDRKIERVEKSTKVYINLKHENVLIKVKGLEKGQESMLKLLETIDKRIYKLNERK